MNKRLLSVCLVLFSSAVSVSVSHAQPQEVIDCFEERTFQYTGGKYQDAEVKYRLHTPETIHYGRKYPLVVHLHGLGEAGSDNTSSLIHLQAILPVLTGPKRQDFFMLVVQCPTETPNWYFQPSTKDGTFDVLMAVMEHVIAENPIDKKRITATGISSGGWGMWTLISKYPDMFAGAVPTACGTPHQSQWQRTPTQMQTPIWIFTNKGDVLVPPPETIREAVRDINASGGAMAFSEANGFGHNAWIPAMETYDTLRWMLAQRKGSWIAPPPGNVIHQPYPPLITFVLHVLPLALITFLIGGTIWKRISSAFQSAREWIVGG